MTPDLIFHYKQEVTVLSCTYQGAQIQIGHLRGLVDEDGKIEMTYHQINDTGQMMTGRCTSTPEYLENGKIRLHEYWQWTSGDLSKGQSILEEI